VYLLYVTHTSPIHCYHHIETGPECTVEAQIQG
jgi:hypothetical protein